MPHHTIPRHAMSHHVTPRLAMSRRATSRKPCHAMSCQTMLHMHARTWHITPAPMHRMHCIQRTHRTAPHAPSHTTLPARKHAPHDTACTTRTVRAHMNCMRAPIHTCAMALHAAPRYATFATSCHATPRHAMPCHATRHHNTPHNATPRQATPGTQASTHGAHGMHGAHECRHTGIPACRHARMQARRHTGTARSHVRTRMCLVCLAHRACRNCMHTQLCRYKWDCTGSITEPDSESERNVRALKRWIANFVPYAPASHLVLEHRFLRTSATCLVTQVRRDGNQEIRWLVRHGGL